MIDHLFDREPWAHQRAGVAGTIDALEAGSNSVCLTSPTGSGKTAMQIALARHWTNQEKRVLCLTNRILLTEQTRKVFRGAGIDVGVYSSSMKSLEMPEAPVQIATIQTILAKRRSEWSWWVDADLVLVDEIHQCATGESAELIHRYKKESDGVVGVTATPLGVSDVCDDLVVAARTRELQDLGILCYADWFAPLELDTRKLVKGRVDLSLSETEMRETWGPLGAGDNKIRTQIVGNIIEHFLALHPSQDHTLAFAPGVKESLWAARYCTSRGIPSIHVDGDDFWVDGKLYNRKKDEQLFEATMKRWRSGEIKILWNRFVLREGIDEPQIKCVMLATPIGSYRSFIQMVGRGLRSHDSKSDGWCRVIDFGGNWWRHGSVNVNVDWEEVYECTDPDVLSKNRIAHARETGEPMGRVCPKCGKVHKVFEKLVVCAYCGHKLDLLKASRPIMQADGRLVHVSGEPVKQWRIKATPDAAERWKKLYFNALKYKKGEPSFNQLYQQYAYQTAKEQQGTKPYPPMHLAYYPPRDLPLMPMTATGWHSNVGDLAAEDLIR